MTTDEGRLLIYEARRRWRWENGKKKDSIRQDREEDSRVTRLQTLNEVSRSQNEKSIQTTRRDQWMKSNGKAVNQHLHTPLRRRFTTVS